MISCSNEQLLQELECTLLKADFQSCWISKIAVWTFEERYAKQFCFKLGKKCHAMKSGSTAMIQGPRDIVPSGSMLALPDPRRPDRANPPTNFWWSLCFFDSTWLIYMHCVPTGQTVIKECYVEVLREFRKIFRRKRPALFKSSQRHFHQDNAPVTDYLTKTGIKIVPQPPYSLHLALCDFCLFPQLRGCSYETFKEMEEAMKKFIDKLT